MVAAGRRAWAGGFCVLQLGCSAASQCGGVLGCSQATEYAPGGMPRYGLLAEAAAAAAVVAEAAIRQRGGSPPHCFRRGEPVWPGLAASLRRRFAQASPRGEGRTSAPRPTLRITDSQRGGGGPFRVRPGPPPRGRDPGRAWMEQGSEGGTC